MTIVIVAVAQQAGKLSGISCQFEEVAIAWGVSLRASIGSDFRLDLLAKFRFRANL
jgi:hypothetical protein